jgi:hypothetical protein
MMVIGRSGQAARAGTAAAAIRAIATPTRHHSESLALPLAIAPPLHLRIFTD